MVTLKNIAQAAGVSQMTVTNALNGTGRVSQVMRDRIKQLADEMGYVPNDIARGLRYSTSKTISFIARDFSNPFFTSLAQGIEELAWLNGYRLLLSHTHSRLERETEYVKAAIAARTDGIIITPTNDLSIPSLQLLQSRNIPFVTIGHLADPEQLSADHVWGNNEETAKSLARHAVSQGHKRIAVIADKGNSVTKLRTRGFVSALQDAGLFSERYCYDYRHGHELVDEMLRQEPPYPTVMLLPHSMLAVEVVERLRDYGAAVPAHIALVCFDDLPYASRLDPLLTVMAQSSVEMGAKAMELLLSRINGENTDAARIMTVDSRLLVRRSCAYPTKHEELTRLVTEFRNQHKRA